MFHDVYDRRFARSVASKTMGEMQTIRLTIEAASENQERSGLWLYKRAARAKLNAVAYAIQNLLTEAKENQR